MTIRTISQTEASVMLDCERKHAFAYTGHLTGGWALKAKAPAIMLRRGRAWGRAVAAWHATGSPVAAGAALQDAVDQDAREQRDAGVYVEDEHRALLAELTLMLADYVRHASRMVLTDAELELRAWLPSRTGVRRSNRYVFHGFVDGLTRDDLGLWVVEFKLRRTLTSLDQVAWMRQILWYAWAAERTLGEPIAGVIVDERWQRVPRPPMVLASGKPSHDKRQVTSADQYIAVCRETGVEPRDDTVRALEARRWQQRHRIMLRRDELDRAERELVSTGYRIAEMDADERYPIANPSPLRCPSCQFRSICPRPGDLERVDLDFARVPPKRLRSHEEDQMKMKVA